MFGKYKVAHLLGITREHEKQFRHVETALTKMGFICFAPVIYEFDVYKQYCDLIDDMCYEKLLACDICVIVTPEHIGKSTQNRIAQAMELNKSVYVWEDNKLKPYVDNQLNVAQNIQDAWFSYGEQNNINPTSLAMNICICGPKALKELPNNTVELQEGCLTFKMKHKNIHIPMSLS